jgi:hypothetical protein
VQLIRENGRPVASRSPRDRPRAGDVLIRWRQTVSRPPSARLAGTHRACWLPDRDDGRDRRPLPERRWEVTHEEDRSPQARLSPAYLPGLFSRTAPRVMRAGMTPALGWLG